MKVLHVCNLSNSPYSGISVVVPQHIQAQCDLCEVFYLNLSGCKLDCCAKQIDLNILYSENFKVDIVIFHGIYFFAYLKIGKHLKRNKIPYIVVPHCSLTKTSLAQKKLKKFISNFLFFSRFLKKSSAIQFLSENEKETSIFSSKGFVCGNGVSVRDVHKTWNDSENCNKFVYVGRLDVFHKGLDILLDAVQLEKDYLKEKKFVLDIFGPKQMKTHENDSTAQEILTKMIADRKLETLVILHDAVYGEDKTKVLMQHDFFIQTSRFEGLPLGVLEALSYGMPCIVTEGTNLARIINEYDSGWGVDFSEKSVSNAILNALESSKELLVKKSRASRKIIDDLFTWKKIANDEITMYKRFLT